MPNYRVMIDIGHGFRPDDQAWDSGALNREAGLQEFDLNGIAALACMERLQVLGVYTALVPFGLELVDRGRMARDFDVFVSIHHNASVNRNAQGTEVAYHKTRSLPADQALGLWTSKTLAEALGIRDRGIVPMNLAVLRGARETNVKAAVLTEGFFMDVPTADLRKLARREGVALARAIWTWLKK